MKSHASLNRIYRLVWNQTLSAWVAVAECARGRGKSSARRKLVANVAAATAALALAFSLQARAGPTDGQVVAGSGAISQAGNTTTVHQSSQNLAINWSDFSVAAHEAVRFNQPNATSIVLNRVLGQSISQIHGAISANGQVFILNPSGILFGAGAQVNVGGLVASTLSLSNDDFMANRFSFSNNGESGGIINQGTLTAAQSGYIAMLAPQVINEGVISATLGSAVMAAGNQVTLNLSRGSLVGFSIDKGAFQALVDNKQLIEADGGQVFMSAKAAEAITKAMVNNSGIIEARTLANVNGRIELISDMAQGTTNVGGILDASAPNGGDGGFIETSGAHVKIADDARITTAAPSGNTGSWLIDPYDFTVAASGGDITGAALGNLLGTNSITIQTTDDAQGTLTNLVGDPNNVGNGDIFINDAVSWSAPTILTLDAYRNIEINQPITASDSLGKLTLKYGQGDSDGVLDGTTASYSINAPVNLQAGLNFSTKLGSTGPLKEYYVITDLGAANSYTATDLQGIRDDLGGLFALGANIDASATRLWNSDLADPATYAGFEPLGFDNTAFNGEFEGLGHTISNLTINRPNQDGVGLFGNGYNNTIRNLALTNVSITGGSGVGALVGNMGYGSIFNSSASGNVSGVNNGGATGGLVGYNKLGSISHSHAAVNVVNTSSLNGDSYIAVATGGLVGLNWGGLIDRSYATGNVTSTVDVFYNGSSDINGVNKVGGLVGLNIRDSNGVDVIGLVSNSYATGRVLGNFYLSIGYNANISSVVGTNKVGGLVGDSINGNTEYSYATGAVEANTHAANYGSINSYIDINSYAGGLLGNYLAFQYSYNSVGNSYATGSVKHNVTFDNSYAVHTQSYGILSASGGLIGKLSDGMVFNSHATGAISVDGFAYADGDFLAGGLVGFNYYGNIYESYATGNLSKSRYSDEILEMGGLVGRNYGGVNQSYATGNLTNVGYGVVGGLVGFNDGNISNSYATGSVNGNGDVGGLVGYNDGGGSVSNSFWDTDTTGQNNAIGYDDGEFIGLEGLSTQEFLNKDSFITLLDDDGDPHWNFGDSPDSGTWFMIDGETRPFLQSEYSTTITNSHQLQLMAMDLDANYTLANNIDIRTAFNNISGMWVTDRTGDNPTGRGFVPLGTYGNQFGGGLDGQGYTISGLTIHRPSLNGVGLFAYGNANASISNVGVLNVNIIGANNVGALVGENRGDILNSHVSGSIVGNGVVGGLVGYNQTTGAIVGSHATVNVFSQSSIGGIGGLVGSNYGTIENSHAAGTVTGISQVGGLAGRNANQISQSYATAEVVGEQRVGGLVGRNYNGFSTSGVISESYARGVVKGGDYVGGLVGINDGATISESYATGVVTGGDYVGGLVGDNSGNITNTFATGVVRGANDVGGLVGYNNGTVTSSFWDTDTTGQADAIGSNVGTANRLVGLSTESFLNENSFTSLLDSDGDPYWTFGNSPNSGTWFMIEGETRPFLQSEYSTTITNSHQLQLMAMDLDANYTLANNIDMRTAFNNVSGMWATDRTGNSPTGSGFVPIGNENESFTGSFDGQNNTITGLSISRTNWDNPVGLFGKADADISNVGLVDVAITSGNGSYGVGGLVGYNYGQIRNSYVTGTVMGISNVGGLVGFNDYGSISNSYSTASVTGSGNDIGGLVGDNEGGNISYTFATGSVTSGDYGSGGLVGSDYNGTVSNSFWDTETTGQLSSGGGTGKTTAEMLTQATYEGWRFGDTPNSGTWFMIDGETRPFLQSEYSTTINNSHQLQLMAMDLNANYTLGNNIDMRTAFNNASGMWATDRTGNSPTGSGFVPVGNENESFTGSFDGQNNTITGLSISRTNWDNPVGLFGKADADISNVGLVDVAITSGNGSYGVGGLVGYNYGQIRNSYVTGTVMGISNVGGLVGFNDYGSISNSYSTASVMGSEDDIGGLVGDSQGGLFVNTYATGIVSGNASVGGLIGENQNGMIRNSYATGSVTGTDYGTGGLVGYNYDGSSIVNSYATGSVSGDTSAGGLVGENESSSISHSFATGAVSSDEDVSGGIVGQNFGGTITASFWDTDTTGQLTSAGSHNSNGKTTAQLLTQSTYTNAGWDFTVDFDAPNNAGTWFMIDGETRPFLQSEYSTTITNSHQLQLMAMDLDANYTLGNNIDMSAEFNNVSGMWATKRTGNIPTGRGFVPVGNEDESFTGSFDGKNHTITGLSISRSDWDDPVGLFGKADADISNVGLVGVAITGQSYVGGLVGYNYGSITDSHVSGSVSGESKVGGLVGVNSNGSINRSYATASVSGNEKVGGLIGVNYGGVVRDSYATGNVVSDVILSSFGYGVVATGGLVGANFAGIISNSYASGNVISTIDNPYDEGTDSAFGSSKVGGLVGANFAGIISNSYASGNVNSTVDFAYDEGTYSAFGASKVGGLVGTNLGGFVLNSYATGNVSSTTDFAYDFQTENTVYGANKVGGLVGFNFSVPNLNSDQIGDSVALGLISNSHASGTVLGNFDLNVNPSAEIDYLAGANKVGGLVGGSLLGITNHSHATGAVKANTHISSYGVVDSLNVNSYAGGLIGNHESNFAYGIGDGFEFIESGVANSYATGSVRHSIGFYGNSNHANTYNLLSASGGLVGMLGEGVLLDSHASGAVSIDGYGLSNIAYEVGGLVGGNQADISNSYATGNVIGNLSFSYGSSGNRSVGGLVGRNEGDIRSSHATGTVTGSDYVGGLVGRNQYGASIENSYATGMVFGLGDAIGGLVGKNAGSIDNSYATGEAVGAYAVGGLVGDNSGLVENSYAVGAVSGAANVGGLVGLNSGNINNTFATGNVTGSFKVGGLVGNNYGAVENSFWDTNTTGQADAIGLTENSATTLIGLSTEAFLNEDNFTSATESNNLTNANWDFTLGSGTWFMIDGETRPFLQSEYSTTITNSHQLQLMAMELRANYTLGNNIDMRTAFNSVSGMWATDRTGDSPIGKGFVPIGSENDQFTGSLDGQGHTISGLKINRPTLDGVGLFGYGQGISNLGMIDVDITGGDYVGGLAGNNYGNISNSYVTGSVSGIGDVGGLVGWTSDDSAISGSRSAATVFGSGDDVGGLVGKNKGSISNSFATGNVTGDSDVGGLVGYNDEGSITNVYATGNVAGTGDDIGGLVGYNYGGTISNSYATGDVEGSGNVGGLVGYNISSSSISFSHATGDVLSSGQNAGALVGYNQGSFITKSYAKGNVEGSGNVGGLVGYNDNSSISFSYATGDVLSSGQSAGGLVGLAYYSYINETYATGNVTGYGDVGGLVGHNGEAGASIFGEISNSYATGSATAQDYSVGGLVGYNGGEIDQSYATGFVTGSRWLGGLVGYNDGNVTDSFWDTDTTDQHNATGNVNGVLSGLVGLSTQAFLTEDNFTSGTFENGYASPNWDFSSGSGTWFMIQDQTRPFLQSEHSTTITNSHQLQLMAMDLNANYTLANNIDMSAEFNNVSGMWATDSTTEIPTGKGFVPVANLGIYFRGSFDGKNHTITGLTVHREGTSNVGLFGQNDASISNVGLINVSITGGSTVGGLVGYNEGTISNSYVSGFVAGNDFVGGLVGSNGYSGTINRSYATASVDGIDNVGGLVGSNYGNAMITWSFATGNVLGHSNVGGLVGSNLESSISSSYATGNVDAQNDVGGLVGVNSDNATITRSFATGNVLGQSNVGGLVGANASARIMQSYATGVVMGGDYVGGLVGINNAATVSESYAIGAVTGGDYVGGLVGLNAGNISNTFASGLVQGANEVGGLVGYNDDTVSNSFWDTETTDQSISDGGTGKTTAEMLTQATYEGWRFGETPNSGTWFMIDGETRPFLQSEYSTTITNSHQLQLMAMDLTASYTLSNNIDMRTAFNNASGMWATDRTGESPTGSGFVPVGNEDDAFTGSFDGRNHSITGLTISRESTSVVGLFGQSDASISNLGLIDVEIYGGDYVGGLAGKNHGNISNSYVTGNVEGVDDVGGLIGVNYGNITNSHVAGNVEGDDDVGGLIGFNYGSISNSNFTGDVSGDDDVGGLIGINYGNISNSNVVGNVEGDDDVGGLIGDNSGVISNSFVIGYVSGDDDVGGLVGYNDGGSISRSHSTAVVTGIGDGIGGLVGDSESGSFFDTFATGNVTGMDSVGGLIGENQNGLVIKSYATGRVSGDYDVGGLVGYTYSGSTINNTYATGSVSGNQSVGGLIGNNEDTTISNSYALGNVSGLTVDEPAKDAGGLVGLNAIDGWIYNSFYDIDNVQINGTHQLTLGGIYNDQFGPWYRNNQTLNINLSEDETGSYQISSVQDLRDMLGFAQRNYSFVQTANINLADDAGLYVPYFHGNFDGKGYTISNPEIAAATNSNVGFFGDLRGNLNDVSVSNMNVSGRQNTGGLVGRVVDRFFVTNSDASGTVTGNGHNVGGLVGVNYGGITNGLANVTVSAGSSSNRIGGLVGSNDELGSINNSTANGDVAGDRDGIYGRSVGGLVGENFGIITNATAHGDVSGSYSIGGLVGYNNGQIDGSDAHGDVDGSYDDVGGLVGTNRANESRNASIRNSAAFGNVAGQDNVGGLAGANVAELVAYGNPARMNISSTIEASYATGSVSGYEYVGGLVGANVAELMAFANLSDMNVSSTIELSYATGSVSGNAHVGGLVGLNSSVMGTQAEGSIDDTDIEARVTNSYATGAVSGNAQLGGLVGKNVDTILGETTNSLSNASINASYATGNVVADAEAGDSVGGLVGFNEGLISNTYATGAVSGATNLGGLVGGGDPDLVTTSYWNTTASGKSSSSGGEGLTATAMKQVASFSAWGEAVNNTGERGAVWRVYEGYSTPLLTGFMERMELSDTVLIYNGNVQTGELVVTNGTRSGTTASGTNVGSYIAYSNQQGYNIEGGLLTIQAKPISITGSRVYDGSDALDLSILSLYGFLGEESLTLSGVGSMNNRYVGVNKSINIGALTLGNCTGDGCRGLASNYTFDGGTQTVTITQKSLNQTGLSVASSKVYDGTRNAAVIGNASLSSVAIGSGNSADGRAYLGDTVSLTGTAIGTYNSKDVLNATTVAFSGLSLSGADANNYSLSPHDTVSATITKADAVVIANSGIRFYNGLSRSITGFSATGLVNGETVSVLSGVSAFGSGVDIGDYPVVASGTDNNYRLSFVDGLLSIVKGRPSAFLYAIGAALNGLGKSNEAKTEAVVGQEADGQNHNLNEDKVKLPDDAMTSLRVSAKD